jgi:transposase-like protein
MRFFDKAMQANGIPEKVTMDKSGANKAAIDEISVRLNKRHQSPTELVNQAFFNAH